MLLLDNGNTCFIPILNYIALKPIQSHESIAKCFIPILNYIALKPQFVFSSEEISDFLLFFRMGIIFFVYFKQFSLYLLYNKNSSKSRSTNNTLSYSNTSFSGPFSNNNKSTFLYFEYLYNSTNSALDRKLFTFTKNNIFAILK